MTFIDERTNIYKFWRQNPFFYWRQLKFKKTHTKKNSPNLKAKRLQIVLLNAYPYIFIFVLKFLMFSLRLTFFDCWLFDELDIKIAAADTYEIFREKLFLKEFNSQENFWLDMTSSLQPRIVNLSRKLGYLF